MRMNPRQISISAVLAISALSFAACGGKKVNLTETSPAEKPGVVSLSVDSIKDKGKKFDLKVTIKNERSSTSIIQLADMTCYRGDTPGELSHAGDSATGFQAGEEKSFKMTCKLGKKIGGDYRVAIREVFDNPSNDGMTPGKVVAKSIEWRAAVK